MKLFPTGVFSGYEPEFGMSLRDFFAAAALIGLMSNDDLTYEGLAVVAYTTADALLREKSSREQK